MLTLTQSLSYSVTLITSRASCDAKNGWVASLRWFGHFTEYQSRQYNTALKDVLGFRFLVRYDLGGKWSETNLKLLTFKEGWIEKDLPTNFAAFSTSGIKQNSWEKKTPILNISVGWFWFPWKICCNTDYPKQNQKNMHTYLFCG